MDDVPRAAGEHAPIGEADANLLRTAIEVERARTVDQIASLERSFDGIVEAAELTSTDDEHDPEGATIAYERAQVSALLRQARDDLVALDDSLDRISGATVWTCATCAGPIALDRLLALPSTRTCIRCAT
ncbi:MAG TPA: TraR/DksA C4-type zinc finger protein [Ilumatobacteraceae bacterium]|nr:TraR/DksA C4-type zinc finger protein [Ilumatobacteraceae bacterium]